MTCVTRLHFYGAVTRDCSNILQGRVPIPWWALMHRLSWKEIKYRQTFSEASADAAWAAFFSWHCSSTAASLCWSALKAASKEAESKLGSFFRSSDWAQKHWSWLWVERWPQVGLRYTWCKTDFKLSVVQICFILAANQVRTPLSAACQVLGCRRSALHSVNGQWVVKLGTEQFLSRWQTAI